MYKLGFDIGGTNIAAGLIDEKLSIVRRVSVPFPQGEDGEQVAALLKRLSQDMLASCEEGAMLESVGIAVPGSIDAAGDTVIDAYNLRFHDVPLRAQVQALYNVPVLLANDANAAALAELHKGVFMGCNTAVLLTLGTGVGGGLILGGRMFNGGNNGGVELGHMTMDYSGGALCTCGRRGCIETLCSATALADAGKRAAHNGNAALLARAGSADKIDARAVIDCARAGDGGCIKLFSEYTDALSSALASIVDLLDPEVIALGGGVSLAGDMLFEPVREGVAQKSFFEFRGRILPASMGNDAGIIGAAMLYTNHIINRRTVLAL